MLEPRLLRNHPGSCEGSDKLTLGGTCNKRTSKRLSPQVGAMGEGQKTKGILNARVALLPAPRALLKSNWSRVLGVMRGSYKHLSSGKSRAWPDTKQSYLDK